jgi:predicted nucleotidyltransferase
MLKKKDVLQILKREEPYLREVFGVKKIALFGSYANGTEQEDSDIDIYLEFIKPIGLDFVRLADYLEEKLGRKIDILTPGGIQGIRIKKVAESIKKGLVYV